MKSRMTIRTCYAAVAVCLSALASAAQQPTFLSRVEAVRLDVLVTVDGRPVRGLQAPDFDVRDNGVPQTLDLVSFEELPLSVVLTLDVSASVTGVRLDHLRDAGAAVLGALRTSDQAALVTFSERLTQDAALTADLEQVRAALTSVKPTGDTALIDGAYAGITIADGAPGRGLVIVFSDGRDTASWLNARDVVDAARRSNAVVYGVSAGARNTSFLSQLARATGGLVYEVESTSNLPSVFLAALDEFRHRYLVSYRPQGVAKGGWHKVDVRVKRRGVTVRARPGYLGGS